MLRFEPTFGSSVHRVDCSWSWEWASSFKSFAEHMITGLWSKGKCLFRYKRVGYCQVWNWKFCIWFSAVSTCGYKNEEIFFGDFFNTARTWYFSDWLNLTVNGLELIFLCACSRAHREYISCNRPCSYHCCLNSQVQQPLGVPRHLLHLALHHDQPQLIAWWIAMPLHARDC